MTFAEAERALDAGKLEMMRPWGDFVPVRRKSRTIKQTGYGAKGCLHCQVWMEAEVCGSISQAWDHLGQPFLRIVA